MNARIDAFATLAAPPVFEPKTKPEKIVSKETIERIAKENNFPSRQAPDAASAKSRRKQRRYRTGRDQHVGIKATAETKERFFVIADEKNVVSGELLKQGLDALEAIDRLQKIAV